LIFKIKHYCSASNPAKVDEYYPTRLGGAEPNESWHQELADTASLTDTIDVALPSGLMNLGDFLARATEINDLQKVAVLAAGVFGVDIPPEEIARANLTKSDLTRTRVEQMLVRLFLPDALELYSAQERDVRVRAVKKQCVAFCKWPSVFKPVYQRATEAMKLK